MENSLKEHNDALSMKFNKSTKSQRIRQNTYNSLVDREQRRQNTLGLESNNKDKSSKQAIYKEEILCKRCPTCYIIKTPRVFHCKVCDCCISVHDHHCPWLGTCIGQRNHQWFVIYIWCTKIHCLLTFVTDLVLLC